jgi:hypothetical protein
LRRIRPGPRPQPTGRVPGLGRPSGGIQPVAGVSWSRRGCEALVLAGPAPPVLLRHLM